MRRLGPFIALLAAACATRPAEAPIVTQQPAPVAKPAQPRNGIIGLSAQEVVAHLGNPALQVREGVGLKLQFRSPRCVLDAYLYPPENGSGVPRVTYIDTRQPGGAAVDQAACISALENPG